MVYKFRTKPYDFQFKVWDESKDKRVHAYFMEMGTGKSLIMANVAAWLYLQGEIDGVVYMARKGELRNFSSQELPLHFPDEMGIAYESYVYSSARSRLNSVREEVMNFIKVKPKILPFLSVNVEALQSIANSSFNMLEEFYRARKKILLLVDESTCVKNHKSKQAGHVYHWAARSAYRRISTGTPITQSPIDVFGQALVLGSNTLGFKSFFAFRGEYCELERQYLGTRTFQKISGYKNLDKLTAKMKTFAHILLKKDCLDLPDKIYTKKIIEFHPEQAKLYQQMRDEALVEYKGQEIEVVNVLSQIIKLHQIACGQLKIGPNEYLSVPNYRLETLVELLEDVGDKKVIIWACYRQTIVDVVKTLKAKFGEESTVAYYGAVSDEGREQAKQDFKHGKAQFFVGNQRSAGFGLTLTEATVVIYYANAYPLIQRLQSEDRAHRIGQTERVLYIDLYIPDTIDDRIMEVLRQRKNLADIVMERPLEKWI